MGIPPSFSYHISYRALNVDRKFLNRLLFADTIKHIINGHVPGDHYYMVSTAKSARDLKENSLEQRMQELFSLDLNPLISMTRQLDSELSLLRAWNTWQKYMHLAVRTVIHGQSSGSFAIKRESVAYEFDPPAARDAALCAFQILADAARQRRGHGSKGGSRQAGRRLSDIASVLGIQDIAVREAICCLEEMPGLNVMRLCKALGCHPRTIERHLKIAGLTAVELKMATALIAATSSLWGVSSLTDIAFENGFSDQAHMTRAFRRACGLPPSVLRGLAARNTQ